MRWYAEVSPRNSDSMSATLTLACRPTSERSMPALATSASRSMASVESPAGVTEMDALYGIPCLVMLLMVPQMLMPVVIVVMARKRMSEMTPMERAVVFTREAIWRVVNMCRSRQ